MSSRENNNLLGKKLKKEQSDKENSADDDNSKENDENGEYKNGRWEKLEHLKFLKGCLIHGNNWKKVKQFVKTRSSAQIRSHAQKYIIKLGKKYKINDSKQLKNLKNLRKNTKNEFLNNLTLNLNHNPDDLEDLTNLDNEKIEETILCIFKSYGNFNEKGEDNLDLEESNKSISNESIDKAYNQKGKIFGTAKVNKKSDKYEQNDIERNLLLKQNLELRNLLSQQNLSEKHPLENINQKELVLLLSLINSENNNNLPSINQMISNNLINDNSFGGYDDLLRLFNQIPNNISNVNNNYLNFNNLYQNNNNFNIINGLSNLTEMGGLLNLMSSDQNRILPNIYPKTSNILNDLNLLNSVILQNQNNNTMIDNKNNLRFSNSNSETTQSNALNNIDTINTNINNNKYFNLNSQIYSKTDDLSNSNEFMLFNLLSGINSSNQIPINKNLNHLSGNLKPHNYSDNPLLNILNPSKLYTNDIVNPLINYSISKSNNSLNTILNKNTNDEKTSEDVNKTNSASNNNPPIENPDLDKSNNHISQPKSNQNINSFLDNQTNHYDHHFDQILNKKAEENLGTINIFEKKDSYIESKNIENSLENKDNIVNLNDISNMQDIKLISNILDIINQNHNNIDDKNSDENITLNEKKIEINENVSNTTNTLKKIKSRKEDKDLLYENNEMVNINNNSDIYRHEAIRENLSPNSNANYQNYLEIFIDENQDKKQILKENDIEHEENKNFLKSNDELMINKTNLPQKENFFNPSLIMFNQNLTNLIGNIPNKTNFFEDISILNQTKENLGIDNLNHMNTDLNGINNDILKYQNSILEFKDFLINNINFKQYQEQLAEPNNNNNLMKNSNLIFNNNNQNKNDLNSNRSNIEIDKLQLCLQEYLKNCTENK